MDNIILPEIKEKKNGSFQVIINSSKGPKFETEEKRLNKFLLFQEEEFFS